MEHGDLIRERGMGLTFFYGTCSDMIRRMVYVSHGMNFNIWKDYNSSCGTDGDLIRKNGSSSHERLH